MTTLKGYGANDFTQANANVLAPDVMRVTWGQWLLSPAAPMSAKWYIDLSDNDPNFAFNAANLQAVMALPSFEMFLLGNESDLRGWTGAQTWVNYKPLIDTVLGVNANAKFAVECGTFLHPAWSDPWFDSLWDALKAEPNAQTYKQAVTGFHSHVYPPEPLSAYLSDWNGWRNDRFPARHLLLTEVGRPLGNTHGAYNPTNINNKCNLFNIDAWFWFIEKSINGHSLLYNNLFDANGNLTMDGQSFAGI